MYNKMYMMIGLPGCGKSTVIDVLFRNHNNRMIVSSDHYIERLAYETQTSYDECFSKENMKKAEQGIDIDLELAFRERMDIIWDQTNLSVATRAKKLSKIPSHYEKIGIVVTCGNLLHATRLEEREGKTIPSMVIENMKKTFQYPTTQEGFSYIFEIQT